MKPYRRHRNIANTPLGIGIFTAILLVTLFFSWRSWSDCRAKNGALVRGVFWYECIAKADGR